MNKKYAQRVELHLHTTTSDARSVITPREAIETAIKMGHRAIAFTDLNSVQNFAGIAYWHKKYRDQIKVIYGVEMLLHGWPTTVLVKNQAGLKALYEVISTGACTAAQRENLLIASACCAGALCNALFDDVAHPLEEIAAQYDYIELPTMSQNLPCNAVQRLYALGKKMDMPVVAVSNCTYLEPKDRLSAEVFACCRRGGYLPTPFYTTQEMLKAYAGLGEEAAYEVVVENTNKLADSIEFVDPTAFEIPDFFLPGDYEEVRSECEKQLETIYGQNPPQAIRDRLDQELSLLANNAAIYLIAHRLVKHLQAQGAQTGYRHYVGSTLIAHLLGISDVNPLPAHYYCANCKHTEFTDAASGYDLPSKHCPRCGNTMRGDGQNIPYEICMGLNGEKDPCIDIQTTPEMREEVARFLKEFIGTDRIAIAGDTHDITERLAGGYAKRYAEQYNLRLSDEEIARVIKKLSGVKREDVDRTYSYVFLPNGMQWEDITPLRDATHPKGGINKVTHMEYQGLSLAFSTDIPKLDVLHNDKYRMLADMFSLTGIKPEEIEYNDSEVYQLFKNLDVCGIPEFHSGIAQEVLSYLAKVDFSSLLHVNSMLHSTNAWNENAEYLVTDHPFVELIGNRDDVYQTLMKYGIDRTDAFKIMEDVRKGRFSWDINQDEPSARTKRWLQLMTDTQVPHWYIESLSKIAYLAPKAHVTHYTKLAVSFAWFKHHYPKVFYQVLLSGDDKKELLHYSDEDLERMMRDDDTFHHQREAIPVLLEARRRGYAPTCQV
jgi:DNA polymerase-3 subunit alpha (Gram-positive type)